MNRNVNIQYAGDLICDPKEVATHKLRIAVLDPLQMALLYLFNENLACPKKTSGCYLKLIFGV